MRIGFIGCGGMGSTHYKCLKLLSESYPIEVTALADAREECLDKASKFWPNAKRYSDGLDLIRNEDVETVFICVPSYLHTDMALAAMSAILTAARTIRPKPCWNACRAAPVSRSAGSAT